jgi:hypothetical protein
MEFSIVAVPEGSPRPITLQTCPDHGEQMTDQSDSSKMRGAS